MSKIFAVIPLVYIVAWFYLLVTWLIPLLDTPFGKFDWAGLSLWSIIAPILFLTLGIVVLIIAFVLMVIILID